MKTSNYIAELKERSTFLMNELGYLNPSIEIEKTQGRKYTSELCELLELLELTNFRESFISLVSSKITFGLGKFK